MSTAIVTPEAGRVCRTCSGPEVIVPPVYAANHEDAEHFDPPLAIDEQPDPIACLPVPPADLVALAREASQNHAAFDDAVGAVMRATNGRANPQEVAFAIKRIRAEGAAP